MQLLAYSIISKGVLWNHQGQPSVPKTSNDWEVLSFASEKKFFSVHHITIAGQGNTELSASLLRFRSTLGPLAAASGQWISSRSVSLPITSARSA